MLLPLLEIYFSPLKLVTLNNNNIYLILVCLQENKTLFILKIFIILFYYSFFIFVKYNNESYIWILISKNAVSYSSQVVAMFFFYRRQWKTGCSINTMVRCYRLRTPIKPSGGLWRCLLVHAHKKVVTHTFVPPNLGW